ncbi:hypothetical protein B0T18DRAFT_391099 [Schizothecium vesticola]|uniref:Uncharacterized protein n=1 Tax=Schizothecium vesticola TaxID=314040 RepID=A0AA40EW72_9PEZI|nr:hypothetical protein B0T18DRAFT_391099 [Schizothecium vesticola]
MVIGLLLVSAIPTTIGICQGLSAQKKANSAAKEKAKFHLTATLCLDDNEPVECWCILKEGKLWIDHPAAPTPGFKFTGWYFTYPSEEQHMGLPGGDAGGHTVGPWGWSPDEQWLTLEGKAGEFVAVEQENGKWAVAWDADGSIRNKGDESDESGEGGEGVNWLPVRLQRRMQLGMESRYIKKSEES